MDDDPSIAELIGATLDDHGLEIRVATDGRGALQLLRPETPDVVLLDVRLPDISGYQVCRRIREDFGDSVGVILISGERRESFDRAGGLLLGADDYLIKPFAIDELLARVERLLRGRVPIATGVGTVLTPREREILVSLTNGLDHRAIAGKLVIAPKTVEKHIEHILLKLGVHSRASAIALALGQGLVDTGASAQVTRFEDIRRRDAVGS